MSRAISLFVIIIVSAALPSSAQTTKPIRDNVGFCWDARQMTRLIAYLKKTEKAPPARTNIVAAISPHDDYLYAARIYYPLYRALRAKQVVIFGVTHGDVRKEIGDPHDVLIFENFENWPGLGRPVAVSNLREYIKTHLDTSMYMVSDKAHASEHSIEALLPFLQYFNPRVEITPIMVTKMSFDRMEEISERLAAIISGYAKENHLTPGKDIAFLISSDADHYGEDFNNSPYGEDKKAHQEATANDRRIARDDIEGILTAARLHDLTANLNDVVWCGRFSIPFGLLTSMKIVSDLTGKRLNGTLLRYSDSYTEGVLPLKDTGMGTTAPASYKHWCGWLSAGYYIR